MNERDAYIGFSAVHGIGPIRFKLLVEYFGTAIKSWEASPADLISIGFGEKLTQSLVDFRKRFNCQDFQNNLSQKSIKISTRIDTDFPPNLREIPDPPLVLYVKGTWPIESKRMIAVVGTRKPTAYGKEITQKLTRDLTLQRFVIVSGLALGIDGIAHQTTLESGGVTIAVLGCGVDIVYPPQHQNLYNDIIKRGGAIISEVTPGHTVLKGLFPARNRIISGLCLGVVVTEGAEDSGSLITARYAAEQGREVFAVPGPITSYLSVGPMKLLKTGAKVVTDVWDILEEFNIENNVKVSDQTNALEHGKHLLETKVLNQDERLVITIMSKKGQMHYDEIVRFSQMPSSNIGAILMGLELSGIIRSLGTGTYCLM